MKTRMIFLNKKNNRLKNHLRMSLTILNNKIRKIMIAMMKKMKIKIMRRRIIFNKVKKVNQSSNKNLKIMMRIKIIKLLNLIMSKKKKFKMTK